MRVVLVDTCVIVDLGDPESPWYEWSAGTLEGLDQDHRLAINPMIYCECSIAWSSIEETEHVFETLAFEYLELPREALFLAGRAFLAYRRRKGAKTNVLPDFLIGAHAAVENHRLLTRDAARYTSYFPTVDVIYPRQTEA